MGIFISKPLLIDGKWHRLEMSVTGEASIVWIDGVLQDYPSLTVVQGGSQLLDDSAEWMNAPLGPMQGEHL